MAITIRDIAKSANVSIATVSRVLNDPEQVSEDKRERIEDAIKTLGYKPNALARGLIKKSIKTIGVLIQDINNIFYPPVIRGIEDELEKHNFNLFLCNTDGNIKKEKKHISSLVQRSVDGIIFLGTRHIHMEENAHIVSLSKEIPIVLINDFILGGEIYAVLSDEVNGAYKAVSYLIELGHKNIAFINGEGGYSTYKHKLEGYTKAMADNNIKIDDQYIINVEPYEKGGYLGAQKILGLKKLPTAIFSASDQIAIGIMKAIYEKGYTIPGDFSLMGFSDAPIAAELYPELTTINQFPYKAGNMAAEMMMKIINNEMHEQRKIIIEPLLSIRKSCRKL